MDPEFLASRKWKTSEIGRFAVNLEFLLYSCSDGTAQAYCFLLYLFIIFKVRARFNEVDIMLPPCGTLYCPLETFKTGYAEVLAIDFDALCDINQVVSSTPISSIAEQTSFSTSPFLYPGFATFLAAITLCAAGMFIWRSEGPVNKYQ